MIDDLVGIETGRVPLKDAFNSSCLDSSKVTDFWQDKLLGTIVTVRKMTHLQTHGMNDSWRPHFWQEDCSMVCLKFGNYCGIFCLIKKSIFRTCKAFTNSVQVKEEGAAGEVCTCECAGVIVHTHASALVCAYVHMMPCSFL